MNAFFQKYDWFTYGRRESATELWKKCKEQKARTHLFEKNFKFSFILSVKQGTKIEAVLSTIESLTEQSYPHWEVQVVNLADQFLRKELMRLTKDKRIKIAEENSAWLDALTGDYTGLVDAGDIVNPSVLFHFALSLQKKSPDLLYCNEVFLDGKKEKLFSKPEYSYVSILNLNYIDRLWFVKTPLFSLDALEEEHLFFIKNARLDSNWELVPIYGVLRRQSKPKLVSDKLFNAVVEEANKSGLICHAVRGENSWNILPDASVAIQSKVSVVICFRDKADWTETCLKNLVKFVGKAKVEVILVNNDSKATELNRLKAFLTNYSLHYTLLDYPHPFNFGHMHNWAIKTYATGEYVFLLNNDVFLKEENRLKDMLGWAALPFVGTVGCLLRYKDGRIQHAGLTAHLGGESRLARVGNEQSDESIWKQTREVFGNTFAACLMKKSTFERMGGFRELDLANGFGDVAFNLDCQRAGLKNINLGYIEGLHLESASRGANYEYWEECVLEQEYPDLLQRMIRYDLGFNRMPVSSSAMRDLKNYAKGKLRQKFPWLKDIKSYLIQLKTGVKTLQEVG